ncbi:MAG TPA: YjjG family noncanonical pyrimidine nucleotidase [Dyadobacter sp.]|jgi:putative hydrolase of the HAD superfamily|nr:YjjG family noncanonical pyrimidine nucleotidase [Dyadobacter sp.]
MKYKHLFFDLDHTLWDFEKNSSESLQDIFYQLSLADHGVSSMDNFVECFIRINTKLWDEFDRGILPHAYIREKRFVMVFEELGIACPENHLEIGELYLHTLPGKKHLLEGALETLNYAQEMGYQMHIVTNGFTEIQARKMTSSGISHYFENIITFENAQARKPEPEIFAFALEKANAHPEECIMIGDNWIADIMGASRFGLDTVYYNPAGLKFDETPTYDIRRLEDLMLIL